jgi:hypothetical protein
LTPLAGARNSSETLDFIEPAGQAQPAPESASRHLAHFLPDQRDKKQELRARSRERTPVDMQAQAFSP